MAKAKNKKSVNLETTKKEVDKEVSSLGLTYPKIFGIIILLLGILLVVINLVRVLEVFIGLVLIYFGLRLFGYKIKL